AWYRVAIPSLTVYFQIIRGQGFEYPDAVGIGGAHKGDRRRSAGADRKFITIIVESNRKIIMVIGSSLSQRLLEGPCLNGKKDVKMGRKPLPVRQDPEIL